MADYGQLDDYGDLTVAQIRDMSVGDFAEFRRLMGIRANQQERVALYTVHELEAREKRDAAFFRASKPPPKPLERWWRARNLYIETGDLTQLMAMEDAVRLEDADTYDEAARA